MRTPSPAGLCAAPLTLASCCWGRMQPQPSAAGTLHTLLLGCALPFSPSPSCMLPRSPARPHPHHQGRVPSPSPFPTLLGYAASHHSRTIRTRPSPSCATSHPPPNLALTQVGPRSHTLSWCALPEQREGMWCVRTGWKRQGVLLCLQLAWDGGKR